MPVRGIRRVTHTQLGRQLVVALLPSRDLTLVDLTSDGPRHLQLPREELIASDAPSSWWTPYGRFRCSWLTAPSPLTPKPRRVAPRPA